MKNLNKSLKYRHQTIRNFSVLWLMSFLCFFLSGCINNEILVGEKDTAGTQSLEQESINVTREPLDHGSTEEFGGIEGEIDARFVENGGSPMSRDAEPTPQDANTPADSLVELPCPPQSQCDDGDPCTYDDHCDESGQRCIGTVITCESTACLERTCNGTSACVERFTTNACDDGQACTYDDTCQEGICRGTAISCTSTTCVERSCNGTSVCVENFTTNSCDDGQACTHSDRCQDGTCRGTSITCNSSTCIERSCNGTASCAERFTTNSCDDGQACTHSDRCQEGSCVGRSITCSSDECVSRSCNGTSSCSQTVHTGRSCGGSTTCHPRSCNSSGQCTGSPIANGSDCGYSAAHHCCNGQCVDMANDAANCGGCGLACAAGYSCHPFNGNTGLCGCIGNGNCRGGATCYNPGGGARCNCQSHDDCVESQLCYRVTGNNYCLYQ